MSRKRMIIAGLIAVPVLALAWWLGSPLILDREVNEDFPTAASDSTTEPGDSDAVSRSDSVDTTIPAETATAADPTTSEPATEPVGLVTGTFHDADGFHQGSGTATVYELEDGSRVLRLQDFEVTNGPDLFVYLVPNPNPTTPGDVDGFVDLGGLKGNIGDQNYDIPPDTDRSAYGSVVIYCRAFDVIFSVAGLG